MSSLSVENEQADAGRESRTRLARPNSQARTGTGEITHFPCSPDHEQDGNLNRLIHTLAIRHGHTLSTVDY